MREKSDRTTALDGVFWDRLLPEAPSFLQIGSGWALRLPLLGEGSGLFVLWTLFVIGKRVALGSIPDGLGKTGPATSEADTR